MCKTELHDIHGCSRVSSGVVESLFPVVKSCVLAGGKQWFGVFGVLEGFANVHAHLPCVFVFALRVLKNVHFNWGVIACSALTPLRGCCFSERLAAFVCLHDFLLVFVASLENDPRWGKTRVCDPMPARHWLTLLRCSAP